MMHRKSALLLSLLLILALSTGAAASKYAGEFMAKGSGARPLALGGAFTALADDGNAVFFNPAALAGLEGSCLSLMHAERFGGIVQVDHAAACGQFELYGRKAGIGLSLLRVGVDDILFTADHPFNDLNENGEFDGPEELPEIFDPSYFRTESDQEWALTAGYGTAVRSWELGLAVKVIYQSVGEYSSFGFGMDAAALSPFLFDGLRFGLKAQDLTGTFIAWSTGVQEFIPPSLRPAVAWRLALPAEARLLLLADTEIHFQDYGDAAAIALGAVSLDTHLGAELWLLDSVALRAGLDGSHWTAGGGLRLAGGSGLLPWAGLGQLTLDYGFGSHDALEGSHRLGLGISF